MFYKSPKMWYQNKKVLVAIVAVCVLLSVLGYFLYKRVSASPTEEFSNDKKTLYFFKANWCGHCQRFKPVWDEVVEHCNSKNSDKYAGIELVELDIDQVESKPLMQKHGVRGFPHVVITDSSESTENDLVFNRNRTKEDLIAFIEEQM